MRATLIHNPTAGTDQPTTEELTGWLRAAGYDVRYASSKRKAYLEALEDPGDLIVIAGGDGTVTKVATRMVGRDVPLAIVPLGTSNNIATTLGIAGAPERVVRALPAAVARRLDVGVANAPWGTFRFVESAGVGLFGAMLEHAERREELRAPHEPATIDFAQRARGAREVLARQQARFHRLEADGVDLSGDYLLVAAMNIRRIGVTLELAPEADPADGRLDLVLLREEDRDALDAHLAQLAGPAPSSFPVRPRRVSVVRMEWDLTSGHLDDDRWPGWRDAARGVSPARVELSVIAPPLTVLAGEPAA